MRRNIFYHVNVQYVTLLGKKHKTHHVTKLMFVSTYNYRVHTKKLKKTNYPAISFPTGSIFLYRADKPFLAKELEHHLISKFPTS